MIPVSRLLRTIMYICWHFSFFWKEATEYENKYVKLERIYFAPRVILSSILKQWRFMDKSVRRNKTLNFKNFIVKPSIALK